MTRRFLIRIAFLLLSMLPALSSFASGKKVGEIDLLSRGYDKSSKLRIWFWNHYMVVEPDTGVCHSHVLKDIGLPASPVTDDSSARPLPPQRVFDVDARREVSPSVLADAHRSACPQFQGGWFFKEGWDHRDIAAAWEKMLVRRSAGPKLVLEIPGKPPLVLCEHCPGSEVLWVSRDLLLMTTFDTDKDEKVLSAQVIDLNGKPKYRINQKKLWDASYAVFNDTGTRFALLWTRQNSWSHFWDSLIPAGDSIPVDHLIMRVFDSSDGHQIFETTFGRDEAEHRLEVQDDLRVALSEDGNLLAYCTWDRKLLIYLLKDK